MKNINRPNGIAIPLKLTTARIVLTSILIAVSYWILGILVDIVFFDGGSFWHELANPSRRDFYIRLVGAVCITLPGIVSGFIFSSQKKTLERLRASENNYRNSLADSPLAIHIDSKQGELVYANKALLDIYGFTNIEEFKDTPTIKRLTAESYQEHENRNNLRKQGKYVPPSYEISILDKIGNIKRIIVSRKDVLWDGETLVQVVFQDVTALKQAEEKARQSTKEWELTFDSIVDMVSIHSVDHRILHVNKSLANKLGISKDEIVGKYCYELFHGTDKPPIFCPHEQTLTTKSAVSVDEYEPHLGIWVQIATAPITNEEGQIVGTVHIVKDITERRKFREQLTAQEKLASIGQLISGVAHELNNPLTSVIGFSDLLLQSDAPENIKNDLKIINDEARRTANIVKGLLIFAHKQPEIKELVSVNEQINKILELNKYRLFVNNIQVKPYLAQNLPQIMASTSQLQQVFQNIVINAEQVMLDTHGKGTLTIVTGHAGDKVLISFADNGPGISPENLKKLFTPFFTTKEVGKGTGLGLSISHGIITEHGGTIEVESKLGQGAEFTILLPVAAAETGFHPKVSASPSATAAKTKFARILVVDDEEAIRKLISTILTNLGHTVDIAGDAEEALRKLDSVEYDAILMDIRMPGKSGMELYAYTKEKKSKILDRFIFMTGNTSDTNISEFFVQNNVPHIIKPFDRQTLMNKLNGLLYRIC